MIYAHAGDGFTYTIEEVAIPSRLAALVNCPWLECPDDIEWKLTLFDQNDKVMYETTCDSVSLAKEMMNEYLGATMADW